ncbi:MAG: acyl-CoA mutase large subunit family protein [Candidatus Hermodarchaeia archaeon]|jgi:methylmalonyl-CoA mutase N-terminal domain/subunit
MVTKEKETVSNMKRDWETTTLKKTLDKSPERSERFITTSSRPIARLYTPTDITDFDYEQSLGFPGQFPYTRGVYPTMYRGRFWTMRMFSGFGTAEQTNARFRYLLEQGQTGLSVAFHLPTIQGLDSDDPMSNGEIGVCGVAIDSLADMEILFSKIPLNKVTTSMTINAPAAVLLCFYIAAAEKQGVSSTQIGGTIQNDILKEYQAQKTWIFPPDPSMRIITNILEFCTKKVPRWNTISISGYHIREAGATAVQELAFTLANGLAYVQAGVNAGLKVDDFAPRLSFFFDSHLDLFEEIAKFRAARRIWAREMQERFQAKNPRSYLLRFHTQTAGVSLTAQQPENNIVRTTIQALAAVLGGTQSLHTNSMDEAWALPTAKAATIALRTQQILAHESGIANTIDPLGGSYFIETLTNEMEEETYKYFDRIEKLGGVVESIKKGFFQREIADSAFRYQREIEEKDRIIVGVNDYITEDMLEIPVLKIDPEVERTQLTRLQKTRKTRNNKKVDELLSRLQRAAEGTENLLPHILAAVREYATVGEICNALRDVYGEYQEPIIF